MSRSALDIRCILFQILLRIMWVGDSMGYGLGQARSRSLPGPLRPLHLMNWPFPGSDSAFFQRPWLLVLYSATPFHMAK